PDPPKPASVWSRRLILLGAAGGIIGLTALATVYVEHRIHASDHAGHDHGDDEHDEHAHEEDHHDAVVLSDEQLREGGVTIATAETGKVVVTVDLPGEIVLNGEATAHVGPRVAGTVRKVEKKLGDKVDKGDVLAVLDSAH